MTRAQFAYGISKSTGFRLDFRISCVFHVDFCISWGISDFIHISEFHRGFLDFSVDFCILPWISGFHRGFENFIPRFSSQPTENSTVCSFCTGSMLNLSCPLLSRIIYSRWFLMALLMSFKLLLAYFRLDYFEATQFQLYHAPRASLALAISLDLGLDSKGELHHVARRTNLGTLINFWFFKNLNKIR